MSSKTPLGACMVAIQHRLLYISPMTETELTAKSTLPELVPAAINKLLGCNSIKFDGEKYNKVGPEVIND